MACYGLFSGLALPAGQHPDLDPRKVVERPRVLYNDATQRFVMWMHVDTADYELASCGMATSASPTGGLSHDHFYHDCYLSLYTKCCLDGDGVTSTPPNDKDSLKASGDME